MAQARTILHVCSFFVIFLSSIENGFNKNAHLVIFVLVLEITINYSRLVYFFNVNYS
jgi:hypothetical protein